MMARSINFLHPSSIMSMALFTQMIVTRNSLSNCNGCLGVVQAFTSGSSSAVVRRRGDIYFDGVNRRPQFSHDRSAPFPLHMITASNLDSVYSTNARKSLEDLADLQIEIQTTADDPRKDHIIEIQRKKSSPSKTSMKSMNTKNTIRLLGNKMKKRRTADAAKKNLIASLDSARIKKSPKKDLLSRQRESELTNAIRALKRANRIREELSVAGREIDRPYEPSETEWAEACGTSVVDLKRILLEGQQAQSELVSKNGGLVVQIAKRYFRRNTFLTFQDMVQEGNMGLMEASERFDPSKGFKFSTYAAWWVRQRILRSIADNSRVIRLPAHVHSMLGKIDKIKKRLTEEIGRVPSLPELAHELEIPVDKLKLYTDSSRNVLSLEGARNANGGKSLDDKRTIGDGIASDIPTPQDNAEISFFQQDIRNVIEGLDARERDVLVLRYGLDDGNPKAVREVARRLSLSSERVRLIESRAMNKLRNPGRNHKLKEYVDQVETPNIEATTPEQIWSF